MKSFRITVWVTDRDVMYPYCSLSNRYDIFPITVEETDRNENFSYNSLSNRDEIFPY